MVRQCLFSRVRACTHAILGETAARACKHAPYNLSGSIILLLALVSVALGQPSQPLPWTERFQGPGLDPAWQTHVSAGNTIAVERGALRISAWQNTYAHVERPLGVDLVRVECTLVPDDAMSWVCSAFLYWDPANWCQVSVLGGGMFYVTELIEGRYREYRVRPCENRDGYRVAIELGEDCIRYQNSPDGREWTTMRLGKRPDPWQGKAPKRLIAGKGFSRKEPGVPEYPAAHLDNDYPDRGARTVSLVREVSVSRTPPDRVRATEMERAQWESEGRDLLGEKELAARDDPSFDSVRRYFPPMQEPREVIGVKDGPVEVAVQPDGSLGGERFSAFIEVGDPPARFGSRPRCNKRLFEGYLPIVVAQCERAGLVYEQTAFGWSPGMGPDAPLSVFVRLRITNRGDVSRPAVAGLRLEKSPPAPPGPRDAKTLVVPARGEKTLAFALAISGDSAAIESIPDDRFQQRLDETAAFWKSLLAKGMRVQVPEPRVNDAYRAWLAYNFLNVDKRGKLYEPHDGGGGFYEAIFGYSAALYCHALDLAGYPDEARTYLDSLLALVTPEGRFEVNFGLPDGGTLLFAAGEHYRLGGDAPWLWRAAPTLVKMCRWIAAERTKAMAGQPADSPVRGLIKGKPYCDEAEHAYSYLTDCYFVLGMQSAAAALGEIGMAADADRIRADGAAYWRDVRRSMDRSAIERGKDKILPLFPESHALLKRVDYSARDYYSLVAGCVLETGMLPPSDPPAQWITNHLERRGGLLLGMSVFLDGVDHAYTYGYWMNCLERDEVKRVILGFYGSLAYGMTRDTYSAVEVTHLRLGRNEATLPHLYSNTQQVRLLRNMLVREDGRRLLLGQAVPRPWLEHGKQVRIEAAPTRFGPVSFTIDSRSDEATILATLDPPVRTPPEAIALRLRHPRADPIRSVRVDGRPSTEFTPDVVTLRGLRTRAAIEVRYRP